MMERDRRIALRPEVACETDNCMNGAIGFAYAVGVSTSLRAVCVPCSQRWAFLMSQHPSVITRHALWLGQLN